MAGQASLFGIKTVGCLAEALREGGPGAASMYWKMDSRLSAYSLIYPPTQEKTTKVYTKKNQKD